MSTLLGVARTPRYFTHLTNILKNLQEYGKVSSVTATNHCQNFRNRFTPEDIDTAARTLGFGVDNDEDIPDADLVENA